MEYHTHHVARLRCQISMPEHEITDQPNKLKTFRKILRFEKVRDRLKPLWSYESMITKDQIVVIDVDGTLADRRGPGQSYADVSAVPDVAQRVRSLKKQGYWIILYTSRNMRTYDGNIGRIMCHTAPVLSEWLHRHDIPYDELHFGKPWCGHDGFYVDDRAIRPREFATLSLEQIETILRRDRLSDE